MKPILAVLTVLTACALVACSSSGSNQTVPANTYPTGSAPSTTGNAVLARVVGVGDSLTAGEESDGLVGVTAANPLFPGSSVTPDIVASQPFGFWADLYNQIAASPISATGGAAANAVLPLIQSPGIGTFLVFNSSGTSLISPQTSCGGLNASAFTVSGALSTRVNPSVTPLDVAVPGQLVHEALYQIAPQGPCQAVSAGAGSLFGAETTNFYPILANFPGMTQIQAARSLKPTLTTVWLGHNDLLKYALSGGAFGPTPASSIQSDLTTIVQTLQQAGSQVVIGYLVDVLTTPLFVSIPNLPVGATDPIMTDIAILTSGAITGATPGATTLVSNVITTNNLTAGSYLTFAAVPAVITYVASGGAAPVPTGLVAAGEALPAAFATQVQTENNAYNTAIAAVAASTGATLVDIHSVYTQLLAGTYAPALIAPPPAAHPCCFLVPFGGLTGNDMLHPSYTGYALIANLWIAAINQKFGTTITAVNVPAINAMDPYAPNSAVFGLGTRRGGTAP